MTITQYPADLIRALPSGQTFTVIGLVDHYWPNDSYTMCNTHHRNLIKRIVRQCESEGIVRKTGKTTSSHAVIWEVIR